MSYPPNRPKSVVTVHVEPKTLNVGIEYVSRRFQKSTISFFYKKTQTNPKTRKDFVTKVKTVTKQ